MKNDGMPSVPPIEPEGGPFPWQQGWKALKSTWPQLVYISTVSIAIPQCFLFWFQSQRAFELGEGFHLVETLSIPIIINILKSFLFSYLFAKLVAFIFAAIGYLSVIAYMARLSEGHEGKTLLALREGCRAFVPGGILSLSFLIPISGLLIPFALAPAGGLLIQYVIISFFVLFAAVPVLLVREPRAPFLAIRKSIRLDYVTGSGISKWSAFFVLLTYEMMLFAALYLLDFCHQQLLFLDQTLGLPREVWFRASSGLPFGVLPFIFECLVWLITALALASFAVFTSSFILELLKRQEQARARAMANVEIKKWV